MINQKKGMLKDIPRPKKKEEAAEKMESNAVFHGKPRVKDFVKEGQQTVRKIFNQAFVDKVVQSKNTDELKPRDFLKEEIEHAGEHYFYMLEMTWLFLYDREQLYKDFSAEQICEKWVYALESGETPRMKKCYQKVGEVAEYTAEEFLVRWMRYLQKMGFSRALSEEKTIVLSNENRPFFANSRLFEDGAAAGIDTYPWMYRQKLVRQGMLLVPGEMEDQVME